MCLTSILDVQCLRLHIYDSEVVQLYFFSNVSYLTYPDSASKDSLTRFWTDKLKKKMLTKRNIYNFVEVTIENTAGMTV